jgi:hypothetical protein
MAGRARIRVADDTVRVEAGTALMKPITDVWPGRPVPGAAPAGMANGVNFAMFSESRLSAVDLCIFESTGRLSKWQRIRLRERIRSGLPLLSAPRRDGDAQRLTACIGLPPRSRVCASMRHKLLLAPYALNVGRCVFAME